MAGGGRKSVRLLPPVAEEGATSSPMSKVQTLNPVSAGKGTEFHMICNVIFRDPGNLDNSDRYLTGFDSYRSFEMYDVSAVSVEKVKRVTCSKSDSAALHFAK